MMENIKATWDWGGKELVGKPVGATPARPVHLPLQEAISVMRLGTVPEPAIAGRVNAREETVLKRGRFKR
jgi:hypothetical protein